MAAKPPFKFWSFFFSLRGRVSRAAYAWYALPVFFATVAVPLLIKFNMPLHGVSWRLAPVLMAINGLIGLLLLWPNFAVLVKRCHDAGLSWFFALPIWFPFLYGLFIGVSTAARILRSGELTSSPFMHWIGLGITAVSYVTILLACVFPARSAGNRYGADPRRVEAASDLF